MYVWYQIDLGNKENKYIAQHIAVYIYAEAIRNECHKSLFFDHSISNILKWNGLETLFTHSHAFKAVYCPLPFETNRRTYWIEVTRGPFIFVWVNPFNFNDVISILPHLRLTITSHSGKGFRCCYCILISERLAPYTQEPHTRQVK